MTRLPFVIHVRLNQLNRRCPWEVTATFSNGRDEQLHSFRAELSDGEAQDTVRLFGLALAGTSPGEARRVAALGREGLLAALERTPAQEREQQIARSG